MKFFMIDHLTLSRAGKMRGMVAVAALMVASFALGGCNPEDASSSQMPSMPKVSLSELKHQVGLTQSPDEDYREGLEQFKIGNYGLAQVRFSKVVEVSPNNAKAWICLAASYDQLRRFDLADKAYGQAIALNGETVEILNNQGFSLMLRGDRAGAHKKFLKALKLDPQNQTAINNLRLTEAKNS